MVELMRLPSRPLEELVAAVEGDGRRRASRRRGATRGRPMIVVAGHIGSNEAVAAALADRGLPGQRHRRRLRRFPSCSSCCAGSASGGASTLIPWRNLRELYSVLRRKEILALLVDWGYRTDGIPVAPVRRVDDAARRSRDARRQDRRDRSRRWPIRRTPSGTLPDRGPRGVHRPVVGPGGHPARHPADRRRPRGDDRRRAGAVVQLQADVARRPGRGRATLEARGGAAMLAVGRDPARPPPTRPLVTPPPGRPPVRRPRRTPGSGCAAASWSRGGAWSSRLPEGPLVAAAESVGELWYRIAPARRGPGAGEPAPGLRGPRGDRPRARAAPGAPPRDPGALERLVRRRFRHAARYYLEVRARGCLRPRRRPSRGSGLEDAEASARRSGEQRPVIIVGMHFGAIELPVAILSRTRRPPGHGADGDGRRPGARARGSRPRAAGSASTSSRSRDARRALLRRAPARASRSGSSPTAT